MAVFATLQLLCENDAAADDGIAQVILNYSSGSLAATAFQELDGTVVD
jgi:hypothetical protein